MIKCIPEEIINKCNKNSIPQNYEKIISLYRKNGFIILVYASKKLEIDEYNDKNELNNYLEDLTFVGFITLENKIKDYVKNSIKEIKKFNQDFVITSGDNVYNCLSAGFLNEKIEDNKNIFILDKEDNNKITIRKIYNIKNNSLESKKKDNTSKFSKNISQLGLDIKQNNINKEKDDYLKDLEIYIDNGNKKIKEKNRNKIINKDNKELINMNSETERILRRKNSVFININEQFNNNNTQNNDKNIIQDEFNSKHLIFMEKYNYHDIFRDYPDVKNSIFCLSGDLFKYT